MDAGKAVLDVSFYRPLVAAGRVDEEPHLLDGVLRSTVGPEAVGARLEVRLPDRFQHQRRRHLNDPVAQGGNAELADFPGSAFGDLVLAHRQRRVGAVPERLTQLAQHGLDAAPCCSTCQRVWPSTPAVFDPRLRFTRSHATSNVAGSQSRLNTSSKRLCLSCVAQRCSLVCHPSTRSSAYLASSGTGVFTPDLPNGFP